MVYHSNAMFLASSSLDTNPINGDLYAVVTNAREENKESDLAITDVDTPGAVMNDLRHVRAG
eukprot:3576721-Amphidinium_carterae.3